jgi:hypothetical protein
MEGLPMKSGYALYDNYEVEYETPKDGYSYFFGYYDKSPLNNGNDKLLCHRVSFDGRDVRDGDIAEIGFIDLKARAFVKLAETLAWNWQQGSQLQWLPPGYDRYIIFNSIEKNSFVSVVLDIHSGERTIIPYPIYAVHPNGKEAIGVNYERHYWCRAGYNYQNIKKKNWDRPFHPEDGLRKINLVTGESEIIVQLEPLINNHGLFDRNHCSHWLEHVEYNWSGSHILFFHRWHEDGKDVSRVYITNSSTGQDLVMLPDNRFFSHYCWKDDNTVTIWTTFPETEERSLVSIMLKSKKRRYKWMKMALRPPYRLFKKCMSRKLLEEIFPHSNLYNFDINSGEASLVGSGKLRGNGHQSWFSDRTTLLNDTYQDERNYRHLMIYDTSSDIVSSVGEFYSFYNDTGFRCDLHPRLSLDDKYIVIDSAHNERRSILILRRSYDYYKGA